MATEPPLVVIVGETASGKSALAMKLAQKFGGEIICADSRTVYIGMDIGTAKPSAADQKKVPHFGLNIVTPVTSVTVADFKKLATEAIDDIAARGKLPIMVGGSGLYVDAVLFNYQFSSTVDAPRDEQNPRHLKDADQTDRQSIRPNTLVIGLQVDREVLRQRISHRVDEMVRTDLVDEVKYLGKRYGWDAPALQATGYKAFRDYVNGEITLQQAKERFIINDMQLAKRQRTWFKRNSGIHWVQKQIEAVDLVTTFLNK